MTPIDISRGTLPSNDLQANNARLRNGYVTTEGEIQLLPALVLNTLVGDIKSIHYSTFNDRIIIATSSEVFYLQKNSLNKAGNIISTVNAVRIDENTQNQVTIVNGAGAWVFDQNTQGFSQLNSVDNGFDIVNPVDVCVLNTITIIVGGTDKKWIVSLANNALNFAGQEVRLTDNSLGTLTGCEDLDGNLFIFGQRGIERWVPSIERTSTDFPFSQDPTYRMDYGCISTASLISRFNNLFYLTPNGEVRQLTSEGDQTITNDGIESLILQESDIDKATAAYFYYRGHYFYTLTFSGNTFVYSILSKRWSEYDQAIISSTIKNDVALTNGVFELSEDFSTEYVSVTIQSPYIFPKNSTPYERTILGSIFIQITQGKGQTSDEEKVFLQISEDNVRYGNRMTKVLSPVGKRLNELRWYVNAANNQFSFRFTLVLKTDITIKRAFVLFQ